jgi:hypothetical protein
MSITVAKYTFSSWLRKGIGNRIVEPDNLGLGTSAVKERARVPIEVMLNTEIVRREFELHGPGDLIGQLVDSIVRTEPLPEITNFEPNYLAFIEFYDEDQLWRFTPARANGQRLRPWLALLVLEEGEFTRKENAKLLPSVTVRSADALPPPSQTWAWGHVHINEGYATPTEFEQFLLSLHELDHPNSDKIISRLVSPRKLKANTAYRAFVVPAFETGRLTGLGPNDVSAIDAQQPSWKAGVANVEFPIYYEWGFRTGENADFESLVKLLEPRVMDRRVGIRDMDGSQPGFGMNKGTDLGLIPPPTNDQTIIGLEGALKAPTAKSRPELIDPTKPFFADLASIVNFPAKVQATADQPKDPVVAPPIYGENHANDHEIDPNDNGWLNDLNRDPRLRVPSGFGTNVIRKHQEDYVARAWAQVKAILATNRVIRHTVFAMETVAALQKNFVSRLPAAEMLAIFAPVMKKVKGSPTTLFHQLRSSPIPPAAMNTALRRLIRLRGAYGRRLRQADSGFSHAALVTDLNDGRITAAPPKKVPPSVITDDRIAAELPATRDPAWLRFVLQNRLLLLIALLLLLLIVGVLTGLWWLAGLLAASVLAAYFATAERARTAQAAASLTDPQAALHDIQNAPPRADFELIVSDPVTPVASSAGTTVSTTSAASSAPAGTLHFTDVAMLTRTTPGTDSVEAKNFRLAAARLNQRLAIKVPERQVTRFDLVNAHAKLGHAMSAAVAFPKLVASQVHFGFDPRWLSVPEHLVPAMAYPDFPDPMYEKLRDISSELFLPNLHLIPPNTISLLSTNPKFIEAYMTGLNHEFGRELLWREYPTDQRGSYFRQFWDVKGIIADDPGLTPAEKAERYKDIVPLDQWRRVSELGTHRNPQRPQGKQLVLLVRGELLKKYPNTIVYAQKAHLFIDKNGVADATKEPVIREVKTEAEMKKEIRFPIFRAEIPPDIRFFGFDMKVEEAPGAEKPQREEDDWGWYFIIQQIPGEPRFGMDVTFAPDEDKTTPITWDDLSWTRFGDNLRFIDTAQPPIPQFFNQLTAAEKSQWGSHSADMANILYQKPVMIAVHAREMLESLKS